MPNDEKKYLPIKYVNREFSEIREDLLQMAERFYPDTFQDFSEASFGAMMVDSVAYVADQLNFYLDYNVNEAFLDTAFQTENILRHGRVLGYKGGTPSSTFGQVSLYVQVPASESSVGPDLNYIPILKRGTRFSSTAGQSFILTENVDFSDPSNAVVVARVNTATGAPTHYAIKSYGNVVSGRLNQKRINVGPFKRFRKVTLSNPNIVEIISIYDSEGTQYYEVENLSQDMIFQEVVNPNYKNDNVPSIMKPKLISRKFISERSGDNTIIQFGSGDASETNVIANPQSVAIDVFGKSYVTDTTFDPTRLSKNTSYGIVPANTTLTITYRTAGTNGNSAVGTVKTVGSANASFSDPTKLVASKKATVLSSLEVSNEKPITGYVSAPSPSELKRRIMDTFPTQNRAVTQADYENLVYRLPSKFGSIKRVCVYKDQDSKKRNLNMYVLSENSFGKLSITNSTIKNNIKTWLNNYRMINDTIDILDPYIVNFAIDFSIRTVPGAQPDQILNNAITQLKNDLSEGFFIGEHISVSDLYTSLNKVSGLLDVTSLKVINKTGAEYSSTHFNVDKNMSQDGTYIMAPANAIFELKYPSVDIKGKIR